MFSSKNRLQNTFSNGDYWVVILWSFIESTGQWSTQHILAFVLMLILMIWLDDNSETSMSSLNCIKPDTDLVEADTPSSSPLCSKQISPDKRLKPHKNGGTEVIIQQPASALPWISCQTLNSLSLKTNNHKGVKLFCHHSFFIPSSLIFPFSFSSNPLHLFPSCVV